MAEDQSVDLNHRPKTSWVIRRRVMFVVLAFCMATIFFALAANLDTKVAEAAVVMAFITILGIVGSYVFGAVWDDANVLGAARK